MERRCSSIPPQHKLTQANNRMETATCQTNMWTDFLHQLASEKEVEIIADDCRIPFSSYTREAIQLHGLRVPPRRMRRRKLRERNKAKYPGCRWKTVADVGVTKQSSSSVAPMSSLSDLSKMTVRRERSPPSLPKRNDERDGIHLALKMPVRQDSFRLRPKLPPVLNSPLSTGLHHKLEGKSTVDMISQVLEDLDLIDQDEESDEESIAGEQRWSF